MSSLVGPVPIAMEHVGRMGEAARISDGAPEREDSYERPRDPRDNAPSSDPLVEVGFSEIFDSDLIEDDDDEAGPWCVDTGSGIECMSTLEIWMSLAAGTVAPDTKVWRDGRPFWMPVAEVEELTRSLDDETLARELEESHPEISQVILKRSAPDDEPPSKRRWRPTWTRWHSLGLVLGVVVAASTAGVVAQVGQPDRPAQAGRVAVDIADQAHLATERALQKWRQPEEPPP